MKTSTSLLRRVLDLEPESWDRFHETYRPLLVSYVRGKGVPESNLEDLVQDILIKLLRAFGWTSDPDAKEEAGVGFQLETLRARQCKFRTWLYRVTENAVRDWWEKTSRPGRTFQPLEHDPVGRGNGEENNAWVTMYRQRILDAICNELPPRIEEKTWNCFAEHILKNRPCAEVAAALGIKPNTVSQNARRVLVKVMERAREEYEEDLSDEPADRIMS